MDPCGGFDCSARGFAVQAGDTCFCACLAGYHPVGTRCVPNDPTDACLGVRCSDHGTCRQEDDEITCDCVPGYGHIPESDPSCGSLVECDLLCVPLVVPDADADADGDADVDAGADADADADGDADVDACPTGRTRCGAACVDLQADPGHCGTCDHVCALPNADAVCVEGRCEVARCVSGWGDCVGGSGDGCETEWSANEAACGACSTSCTSGETCRAGDCVPSWQPLPAEGVPAGRAWHTAVWTGSQMIVWGGQQNVHSAFPDCRVLNSGAAFDPATGSWTATRSSPCAGRYLHSAVWTGDRMIVWGGAGFEAGTCGMVQLADGCEYFPPPVDAWNVLPDLPAGLVGRGGHSAVWTGSEMVVWGGRSVSPNSCYADGAAYSPATRSWRTIEPPAGLDSRWMHVGVWCANRMVVWGGWIWGTGATGATGGLFDDGLRHLGATSLLEAPLRRTDHEAVCAESLGRVLVWGGYADDLLVGTATGGVFDPVANAWRAGGIATLGAPTGVKNTSAIWTGSEMIVWGGRVRDNDGTGRSVISGEGARYSPESDSWRATAAFGAPEAREAHTAVWSGTEMLLWGGDCATASVDCYYQNGYRYLPP